MFKTYKTKTITDTCAKMAARVADVIANPNEDENRRVRFSVNNAKMGPGVVSVSLPPVLTCSNCKQCASHCYALGMCAGTHGANIRRAWSTNLGIYKTNPRGYFRQIAATADLFRFFRWHVGGEIMSEQYLNGMCEVAAECPATSFLVFTKSVDIINSYFMSHKKPDNLTIILSGWEGVNFPNWYGFPTSDIVDSEAEAADGVFCPDDCRACGHKCWKLQNGEKVYFLKH